MSRRGARTVHGSLLHRALAASLTLLALTAARCEARPALHFDSPFAPQLCGHALAEGRRQLRDAPSPGARQLIAEGYLCGGLQDDPWALHAAATLLREVVAEEPANFFAQLELADAVRLRFPLSGEAERSLRRARTLLTTADVGAARARLAAYIDENLAALAELRARLGVDRDRLQAQLAAAGGLPSAQLREAAGQLGQMGGRESLTAAAALAAHLEAHPDDAAARLQQAEALRGLATVGDVRALYERVLAACRSGGPEPTRYEAACQTAHFRLGQMDRVTAVDDDPPTRQGREP